jgi:hypothetical protein
MVAYVRRGIPELLYFKLEDEISLHKKHGYIIKPHVLDNYYAVSGNDQIALFGDHTSSADELVAHLRSVVAQGIQEEARLKQGKDLECGGSIDAVKVDKDGAKLVN